MIQWALRVLFVLVISAAPAAGSAGSPSSVLRTILTTGGETSRIVAGGDPIRAPVALRRFYTARGFAPAWTGSANGALRDELTAAIEHMREHGLTPEDYHAAALQRAIAAAADEAIELLATDAFLTMAAHLIGGRLDPVTIEPGWTAVRRERDLVEHLESALAQRRIAAALIDLEPDAPGYGVLKMALATYREADRQGGWEPLADGPALKLGQTGPRVAGLRRRLQATGLLATTGGAVDHFDIALESAVAEFQRRIGLEADGVVGPLTLQELNKPPAERIEQIRVNLERWRWLPEDLGERHIRVNIADFDLQARHLGIIERRHDVIVGRPYRMTPVFSETIAYLVFNPWWETPERLARQDKLPAFQKDSAAVARLGFDVLDRAGNRLDPAGIDWQRYSPRDFPFRLRQRPGPQNALGQVKIMFPNKHNVYLHDTPSRELFARSQRAFSSGCVRVADALGLAEWLLEDPRGWPRERIDTVVAAGRELRVNLRAGVPVHIVYLTAVAQPDGRLRLIHDLYGRDARVSAALRLPPPTAVE